MGKKSVGNYRFRELEIAEKSVLVPSSVIEGWLRECSSPERIEARLQEWKRQHPTNWNVLG